MVPTSRGVDIARQLRRNGCGAGTFGCIDPWNRRLARTGTYREQEQQTYDPADHLRLLRDVGVEASGRATCVACN
jgi:hypothetical protein